MGPSPHLSVLRMAVLTTAVLSIVPGDAFGNPREIESGPGTVARVVPMEPLPLPAEAPQPAVPLEPLLPAPDATGTVEAMVRDWALAWSEQRVDDYLSFYGREFQPSGGASLSQWFETRRRRVSAPSFIRVTLDSMKSSVGPKRAWVEFVQSYESSSYRDVVVKLLDLSREGEDWKIMAETVLSEGTPFPPDTVAAAVMGPGPDTSLFQ